MRLAFPTLAFAFVLAAGPASAQLGINGTRQADASQRERPVLIVRGQGHRSDLRRIGHRVQQARNRGEISRCEARSVRRQVAAIRSTDSYAGGGLSDAELAVLDHQTFALRDAYQAPARPRASCRRR
ncbi:MAG TPA: hypothetical protein VEC11_16310 [Allosphingosinicella sp.]|nr:hypothetical protein [Allosphingosinicella sp.]